NLLTPGDIAWIIAHNVLHWVLEHPNRQKKYPKLWNAVCDVYIDTYLTLNMNWVQGFKFSERPDWLLNKCAPWVHLPKDLQVKYPVEQVNRFSCDELYLAVIEWCKTHHIDPAQFEQRV